MTGRKNMAVDDGTCLFCPCFTIRVLATWVHYKIHIPTERILFPRVDKLQLVWCHVLASSFKVILHVAIIVPTQTTDRFLDAMKALISVQQITKASLLITDSFLCFRSECHLQIFSHTFLASCARVSPLNCKLSSFRDQIQTCSCTNCKHLAQKFPECSTEIP